MAEQVLRPFVWFYHAFGVDSIQATGRNAYLIITARTLRMFAFGTNSLILALFFAELSFTDEQIGMFMTLTLLGDVFLGVGLTFVADRIGRRKVLLVGSLLMTLSGITLATMENFWVLLLAAIVGVISATGGDFGPFRAIEESIISQLTTSRTRSDVLAWYVTLSTWGSSLGSEASGRLLLYLQGFDNLTLLDAYHSTFWVYTAMGLVNALLVLLMSNECESPMNEQNYSEIAQGDDPDNNLELDEAPEAETHDEPVVEEKQQSRLKSYVKEIVQYFAQISAPTRKVMYKLWFLLAIDSVADGMVPYSLTNYYMDTKFHPAKSTLGDATSVAYFLGAIGGIFAGPLANRLGLIRTMVYTHIPSSAAVLFFPLPPNLWLTIILLFIRTGLNNMDQAPRSAFIAAVVKPQERTAVMGITAILRNFAAMMGPSLTGLLAGSNRFWVAFVAAGACRLVYDVGLYAMFVNMKLHQHEKDDPAQGHDLQRLDDEEELASLASFPSEETDVASEEEDGKFKAVKAES